MPPKADAVQAPRHFLDLAFVHDTCIWIFFDQIRATAHRSAELNAQFLRRRDDNRPLEIRMLFTAHEMWALLHGLVLGGGFIVGCGAYAVALLDLGGVGPDGSFSDRRIRILAGAGWLLAAMGWTVVFLGTFVVQPWYRSAPPPGATDLSGFPRAYLLSNPALSVWHVYGMEWKEFLGWIPPILVTAVAFVVWRLGGDLAREPGVRRTLVTFVAIAFVAGGIVGALGALITKVAPVR